MEFTLGRIPLNKGDKVLVSGQVLSWTNVTSNKVIKEMTFPTPKIGIIIGYSFIRTGQVIGTVIDEYGYIYEQGKLENIVDHKVWLVEPLRLGNRYLEPYKCFEHQIKKNVGVINDILKILDCKEVNPHDRVTLSKLRIQAEINNYPFDWSKYKWIK